MAIHLIRPAEAEGTRLFYRTKHDYNPRQYNPFDPLNVLVQMRLYRRFLQEAERARETGEFGNLIEKDHLMNLVFFDQPRVKKQRVGRILRFCIQYEPGFQRNPAEATGWKNRFYWRWNHPLEIVYGLEYLMLGWLPAVVNADDGSCNTAEEYEEELEIIRDQDEEDDDKLLKVIMEKGLEIRADRK